ncbi:MAG: carboxy-S-adenosyl-L-methionine synthase CmoA [Proteobacteria bacterium]|nr:carboxy-S-adenosyl-L-methionine synthase CmoA [Pseudomonadota bacterium]
MGKDNIYSEKHNTILPFEFNKKVVDVFDDMIHRSVPLYHETILRQSQLAEQFYQPGTTLYDLGCSNGNFGLKFLDTMGKKPFHMIAVDNSRPMLDTYAVRLENRPMGEHIHLTLANIQEVPLKNASVVIINLTLQFLPVHERDGLIKSVFESLSPSGVLLITEKTRHENIEMTELFQNYYYRFKMENGYSNLEISQKRDALETVLIPESVKAHLSRFSRAGFTTMDVWQKWFNFTSFICIKH